jgi:hypothetical protein
MFLMRRLGLRILWIADRGCDVSFLDLTSRVLEDNHNHRRRKSTNLALSVIIKNNQMTLRIMVMLCLSCRQALWRKTSEFIEKKKKVISQDRPALKLTASMSPERW